MKLKNYALATVFGLFAIQSYAQQYISAPYVNPHGIANDGTISCYEEWGGEYYLWHPDTNEFEPIGGIAPGNGFGGLASFSDDSNLISGTSFNSDETPVAEASYYNRTTKTWTTLGNFGFVSGSSAGAGYNISGDGKVIVGHSGLTGVNAAVGFAWNQKEGKMRLKTSIVDKQSRAEDISKDGSTIVGYQANEYGHWEAAVWYKNQFGGYFTAQRLVIDPNKGTADISNRLGWASAVSDDGKWIGGYGNYYYPKAWLWNMDTGLVDLGTLTEDKGTKGYVTSITKDGSTVYGYYLTQETTFDPAVYRPFIWTKKDGIRNLNDYVRDVLKLDLQGDNITVPTELSSNEKYLVGWAINEDTKKMKIFRIEMSTLGTDEIQSFPKATLYPNPVTNVLNIDAKQQISSVSIYTLTGQQIFTKSFQTKSSTIDMSAYKAGVYIVEVNSNGKTQTYKVIKK